MRTALYRHFDGTGRLLYVGVSLSAVQRLAQHKQTAHWFQDIRRVDIEWFQSRDEALDAEARAIHSEGPVCNVARPNRGKLAKESSGVLHIASGRIDGWYSRNVDAVHMLGWWQAMFGQDEFKLVYPSPNGGNYLDGDRCLITSEWKSWAKAEPDYKAADLYDERCRRAKGDDS